MDLYDIAVARKLSSGGGGGGVTVEELNVTDNGTYTAPTGKAYSPVKVNVSGGGSSDFSTATVTIVGGIVNGGLPYLINDFGLEGLFVIPQGYSEGSHTIALWHGTCIVALEGNLSISGSIEDMGEGMYLITGDCTITIS